MRLSPFRPRQAALTFRHDHEMNVIAHEAIPPHAQAIARGVVEERIEVDLAVAVGEEDILAPVAALGDMMRCVDGHGSGCSCHTQAKWRRGRQTLDKIE